GGPGAASGGRALRRLRHRPARRLDDRGARRAMGPGAGAAPADDAPADEVKRTGRPGVIVLADDPRQPAVQARCALTVPRATCIVNNDGAVGETTMETTTWTVPSPEPLFGLWPGDVLNLAPAEPLTPGAVVLVEELDAGCRPWRVRHVAPLVLDRGDDELAKLTLDGPADAQYLPNLRIVAAAVSVTRSLSDALPPAGHVVIHDQRWAVEVSGTAILDD